MRLLYQLSILLYWIAARLLSIIQPKAKLFVSGRKGLINRIKIALENEQRPRIWFHCSSLGEFEQARPLIEKIRFKYPNCALILTFFSPSGYEVRKNYEGVDFVFYLPIDTPKNAHLFVEYTRPQFVVFVKYDLWYFYLNELSKNKIPCTLIDAIFRPQQGFFKWFGSIQRKMLQLLSVIFVQNHSSLKLLRQIGVTNVKVAGDTRFDRVVTIANNSIEIELFAKIAKQKSIFIAGSTWHKDELLLAQFLKFLPENWILVIAPHEVNETRINEVIKTFDLDATRWTSWDVNNTTNKVLIIDKIGYLSTIYKYATIAWIGGGFTRSGIHNVLEAAVYGLPCIFGPNYQKYQEAVLLLQEKAAFSCSNANELKILFNAFQKKDDLYQSTSKATKAFVLNKAGASEQIMDYLEAKNWLRIL